MKNAILSLFSIAALAACSGGGGSDPAPASNATSSVEQDVILAPSSGRTSSRSVTEETPSLSDGLWYGFIADRNWTQPIYADVFCLLDDGAADCMLVRDQDIYGAMRGSIELNGERATLVFDTQVPSPDPATITSTDATYERTPTSEKIDAYLDFERYKLAIHRPTSPAHVLEPGGGLDGVYLEATIRGEASSLTVDEDGSLFAQSQSGCVYSGAIEDHDISLSVSNCGEYDGEYVGLALLTVPRYVRGSDVWLPLTMLSFAVESDGRHIGGYGKKDGFVGRGPTD